MWCGCGLRVAAVFLPGFAVKTVRLGCGVATPPWLVPYLKYLDIFLFTWQCLDVTFRFLYWFLLFSLNLFFPAHFVFVCHLFHIAPLLYVTWLRINNIYINNVFSHWLWPCSEIDHKRALVHYGTFTGTVCHRYAAQHQPIQTQHACKTTWWIESPSTFMKVCWLKN